MIEILGTVLNYLKRSSYSDQLGRVWAKVSVLDEVIIEWILAMSVQMHNKYTAGATLVSVTE